MWGKFVDADIIDNPEEDIYNQEGTDIYEVTTNEGYVVEIIVKEDGTVEIGDIVKGDNLPPRIGEITSSGTSSSIHVEVNITRSEGKVSISYYYKKDGEEDSSYKALKENVADLTADFTGLEQNAIYDIKVVVTDDNGSTEKVISEITGELAEGTISQVGETQWNDGTATIQLETTETAEEIYIVYQIGGIDGEWLPYPEEGISGLNHGDMIYVAISDGTNVSKESSFEIEDGIAPNTPTINLSGTNGNNNYYKSNVTITITAGSDGQSGANQVRYSVSGAQIVEETTTAEGTTSATVTISTDGTSTITAYTIDKAGNVSEANTQVVNKDGTVPSAASLTVETVGETSIAVIAQGADVTSGIYSYEFQRSTTSATSGFATVATQISTEASYSYTYTGLTAGTTYYLRVIVTDRAGNTRTGTAVTQMVYQKAVNKLEVGDYVCYQATNTSYATTRTYDGRTEIINPSSYTNGWQVLSNDGTTIQIISSKTVPELNLASATGFQHLVEDADRYCASYADGNLVTGGRAAGSYGMKQVITENDYAIGASYTLVHEEPTHDIQLITNAGLQNVGGAWDLVARYANPVATKPGSVNYGSWTYTYSGSIVHTIYFTVNSSNGLPTDYRDYVLALRPILTLKSDAVVTSGDGDSLETAYHLK